MRGLEGQQGGYLYFTGLIEQCSRRASVKTRFTCDIPSIMSSKPAYPPGGTWFDTLKKSFTGVTLDATNDNAIPTSDFLEAAESLTSLFGIE